MFVLAIALWQGLTTAFHVQTFLLPKPSDIAQSFWENKAALWHAGWYTFKEAAGGLVIGSGSGSSRLSSSPASGTSASR